MDKELAEAVFQRWSDGLPVFEGTLYKAASELKLDPDAALAEARFYTHLDRFLLEKRAMTFHEKAYFGVATGLDPLGLIKTANAHSLAHEDLIVTKLAQRNFVPDLKKLSFLGMQGGPTEGPAMEGGAAATPPPVAGGPGEGSYATSPTEPQQGAQVQQQPEARVDGYKASPTAPQQIPPAQGGNFEQLLQGAGQADAAGMGGGLPPSGMGAQQTPPPPTAEEKLQQAFGNQLDPDTLSRYAPKLEEFEQQVGMSIQDPKQIEKFVKELQKGEKKQIDEAIKVYGEQQAQLQSQAMGGGTAGPGAQLDKTAPIPKKPGVNASPLPGGEDPMSVGAPLSEGGAGPNVPQKPQQKKPSSEQAQAMAKVAAAARAMAHAPKW